MFLTNGSTSKKVMIFMADSSDHITGKTGLTVTVTKSKNGAAFGAWSGSVAEVSSGWYACTPAAGDVDTDGIMVVHGSATGADPADVMVEVLPVDVFNVTSFGLSRLDIATSAVWDQAISSHTSSGSFGQVLQPVRRGTCPSGPLNFNEIVLDAGASNLDDYYNGQVIALIGGSGGSDQSRRITDYNGSTQTATVDFDWVVVPSGGSVFMILASADSNSGAVLAAIATRSAPGDAMALTAGERTTLTNAILDLASTVDTYTLRQIFRLMASYGGGKSSGGASDDTIQSIDGSKNRIVATMDSNGHRQTVALDLT